jgi:hypothetical protein
MASEPDGQSGTAAADAPAVNVTHRMTGGQFLSIVLLIFVHTTLLLPICLGLIGHDEWDSYPFALLYAQGYLLAAYLALGQQSPAWRWAFVGLIAPLWWLSHILLKTTHREYDGWYAPDASLAAVSAAWGLLLMAIVCAVLWCCRRCFHFQWTTSAGGGRRRRSQFRLRQLLLWMAGAAVVCGMIRAGLPKSEWEPLRGETVGSAFQDVIVYAFGLALAIPCTLAAVGRHRWTWWWLAIPLYYVFLVAANSVIDAWRWSLLEVDISIGYYSIAYATGLLVLVASLLWVRATFERPAATASADLPPGDHGRWGAPRNVSQKVHAVTLLGLLLACFVVLDLSFAAASAFLTHTQLLMAEGVLCGQCTLLGGWLMLGRARQRRRAVWGILAMLGLCASAVLLRLSFRMSEPYVYDRPWTWDPWAEGVLFLLWFDRSEPLLWTCAWPAGAVVAMTLLTMFALQWMVGLPEHFSHDRRSAAEPARTRRLVKCLAGIAFTVGVAVLLRLAMLGEQHTDIRLLSRWTWPACGLLVSQVLVHVLSAAVVIAWLGKRTPGWRSWLILAVVIIVCGIVAAADAPSLLSRVTTVIAVHLATLAAGLAVAHAAHRGRCVVASVPMSSGRYERPVA